MTETRLDRLHALSVRYLADLDTARQRAEANRREHSLTDDAQLAAAVSVGFGEEQHCRHAT